MLPHTNLLGLIVLSLELASLLVPAFASPSIKFIKAASHPNDNSHSPAASSTPNHPTPGSTNSTDIPDLARLCPSVYKPEDAKTERKLKHAISRSRKSRNSGEASPYTALHINVVWHSVSKEPTPEAGFMAYHRMQKSVDILNEHFAPANIQFSLNRVDRYGNERWYNKVGVNNAEAYEMRGQTHVGGAETLNIWSTGFTEVSWTGGYVSYFPWDITDATKKDDGIVMRHDFFVDSGHYLFNDGKYLTHEVGHWVGLYHTFEGGPCNDWNDGVEDTPAQVGPTYVGDNTCIPVDTCPGQPGNDPITNFMDYSNPTCQSHFTDGQIDRMRTVLNYYRGFPL